MASSRQLKRLEVQRQIIKHFDEKIPSFTDLFDEKTFYIFFACITIVAIIIAFLLAYCCQLKINDIDELRKKQEKRDRKRKEKLALKMLEEKLNKCEVDTPEYNEIKYKITCLLSSINRQEKDSDREEEFDEDSTCNEHRDNVRLIRKTV